VLVIAGVAAFFVFVQGAEEPPAAGTPGAPTQVSPPPAQTAERQPAPATAATPATPATPDNGNTRVKLTRTTAETYEPGGEVSVTVRLEKEGDAPVRALGMKEVLPSGWSYQAAEGGEQPDLNRQSGGTVEFAWITVPAFPFEFSYTLRAADGAAGAQTLTGEVLYRLSGPELSSGMVLSEIAPAEGVAAAAPAATPATEPADDPAPTDAPQPAGQPNTPANTPAAATTTSIAPKSSIAIAAMRSQSS